MTGFNVWNTNSIYSGKNRIIFYCRNWARCLTN